MLKMYRSSRKLTKEELKKIKKLLLIEKKEIFKMKGLTDSIIAEKEENIKSHIADMGTNSYFKEIAGKLTDIEHKTLVEIDRALKKIDNGNYGICEFCKKPINKQRLKIIPYVRFCIECQNKLKEER